MSRTYTLDAEAAKQAGASNYINETGKYAGTFVRAEAVTSKQLTEGVEFTFKATDGRTADYLTCWTYNVDGKPLYGLKMLNAIMTCMRVRGMEPASITVKANDGTTRSAEGFPTLMNKPIGVLLQREEYTKNDGAIGYKFNLVGAFEPQNGMTASEVLEKASKPEQLEKWVAQLRDKPMQAARSSAAASPARHTSAVPAGGGFDEMLDSDIPF